jgi:hypothetical protein
MKNQSLESKSKKYNISARRYASEKLSWRTCIGVLVPSRLSGRSQLLSSA